MKKTIKYAIKSTTVQLSEYRRLQIAFVREELWHSYLYSGRPEVVMFVSIRSVLELHSSPSAGSIGWELRVWEEDIGSESDEMSDDGTNE